LTYFEFKLTQSHSIHMDYELTEQVFNAYIWTQDAHAWDGADGDTGDTSLAVYHIITMHL
jgi:hypothetical protein